MGTAESIVNTIHIWLLSERGKPKTVVFSPPASGQLSGGSSEDTVTVTRTASFSGTGDTGMTSHLHGAFPVINAGVLCRSKYIFLFIRRKIRAERQNETLYFNFINVYELG
jgi:hypothetical protein